MAKFDLKFIDASIASDYIKTEMFYSEELEENVISIEGSDTGVGEFIIVLDKSTAIKFAKTLRTEINKIES